MEHKYLTTIQIHIEITFGNISCHGNCHLYLNYAHDANNHFDMIKNVIYKLVIQIIIFQRTNVNEINMYFKCLFFFVR